jgi:hypothetical protein
MPSAFFSSANNILFPAKNQRINTGTLLKIYITYRKNSFSRFLVSRSKNWSLGCFGRDLGRILLPAAATAWRRGNVAPGFTLTAFSSNGSTMSSADAKLLYLNCCWLHPILSVEFFYGAHFCSCNSSQCDKSDQIAAMQLLNKDPFFA